MSLTKETFLRSLAAGLLIHLSTLLCLTLGTHAATQIVMWGQAMAPPSLTNAIGVAAGYYHSVAATADNRVVAWGNPFDYVGRDDVPFDLTNAVAVAASYEFSVALRADGHVVAWGWDCCYQTNVPSDLTNAIAIAAGRYHGLALQSSGQVIGWGANNTGQIDIPLTLNNAVAIAAGEYHSLAATTQGKVVGWGASYSGEAVPSRTLRSVIAVAAGSGFSLALRADGTVVGWGENIEDEVTIPPSATNVVAIAAGVDFSLALRNDGTVVAWGANGFGETSPPSDLSNVVAITGGRIHSLALQADGRPVAAGRPLNRTEYSGTTVILNAGAVGAPPLTYQWQVDGMSIRATGPFLVLSNAQVAQTGAYSVLASNAFGVATITNTILEVVDSSPLFALQPSNQVAFLGEDVALEVQVEGSEPIQYQWLYNGQALSGATNPVLRLAGTTYNQAGQYSVFVRNAFGSASSVAGVVSVSAVAAWGSNVHGETNVPPNLTNVTTIAAGLNHNLVLKSDGTVVAWGADDSGQIDVPQGMTNVVAGGHHSLALVDGGTVVSWGGNDSGQTNVPIGLTNVVAIAAGFAHSLALRNDRTVAAWGADDVGQTDVPQGLTNVIAIAAGYNHSMALKEDGKVAAWGSNAYGETNVPFSLANVVAIAAGVNYCVALKGDGTLVAWGRNDARQTQVAATASNCVAVVGGGAHGLALVADGQVVGWGENSSGQISIPYDLKNVLTVAAGYAHSIALIGDGSPTVTGLSSGQTAYSGTTLVLNAMVTGGTPLYYQWQFDGHNLNGATNAFFTLTNLQSADIGSYTVLVSNALGTTEGPSILLNVLNSGPISLLQPVSQHSFPGGSASFQFAADGSEPLQYRWFHEGLPIPGGTDGLLTLNSLSLADAGRYQALASNAFGVLFSSNAVLSIPPVQAWGFYYDAIPEDMAFPAFAPDDLSNVVAMAGGYYHSLALRSDGTVASWGVAYRGGTDAPTGLSNVVAIAAAGFHSLALRNDGTVIGWGDNNSGQSTPPSTLTNAVAVAAGDYSSLALTSAGAVVFWGAWPAPPSDLVDVVAIAAGKFHSVALKADGTVVAWGNNAAGQTNVPAGLSNVIAIAAGGNHSVALKSVGTALSWGDGIIAPPGISNLVSIASGEHACLGLKSDGTLVSWNCDRWYFFACPPTGLEQVIAVSSGAWHGLALVGDALSPPAVPVPIALLDPRWSAAQFTVSLPSTLGKIYSLEFKDSLDGADWKTLPLVVGDGSVKTLSDTSASTAQRFYRVRRW
jgi:alpha-tubulin suppressor-like RCC1 family protein